MNALWARWRWPAAQALVVLAAMAPLIWVAHELATQVLQNPPQHLQRATGRWAFRFLLATLAVTPLRQLTGWTALLRFRRTLGLLCFFYACLHLLTYTVFDFGLDAREMAVDAASRPFVIVGLIAFILLLPLAATSTRRAQQALGRRWKTLHRAVYAVALLVALHRLVMTKVDFGSPLLHAALVATLLGWRVVSARRARVTRDRP